MNCFCNVRIERTDNFCLKNSIDLFISCYILTTDTVKKEVKKNPLSALYTQHIPSSYIRIKPISFQSVQQEKKKISEKGDSIHTRNIAKLKHPHEGTKISVPPSSLRAILFTPIYTSIRARVDRRASTDCSGRAPAQSELRR